MGCIYGRTTCTLRLSIPKQVSFYPTMKQANL
ncbi:MAG: hypothetical protein LBI28_08365 [Treponema sp.]|nr:hypothetical protein [Treponema sp.]